MWPFSEIKLLKLKIEGLEKKKRELENTLLSREHDNFHEVAKDFDATKIADKIVDELLDQVYPVFKGNVFKAVAGINFGDKRQTKFNPKISIAAMRDMTIDTYECKISLPALNYRFRVFNG